MGDLPHQHAAGSSILLPSPAQETSPSPGKKMPLCLYFLRRMQTKPPLLPVTADPFLCLVAGCWHTEEPREHHLRNRRWRSERCLRAHRGVCRCTNTHLPRTHRGRCKSDLQEHQDVTQLANAGYTGHLSLDFWIPLSMFPPDVGMGRRGCARLPVPHAPRAVLCLLSRHTSCARQDCPQEPRLRHSPFSR